MSINRETIESNLRLHVDRLAGLIGPRTLSKPKTIEATIGYLEGQWLEMGYRNERECYDAIGDQATNLVVEQSGTKRADEIVLLGAHYDTVPSTPGADDNASAVAVLLEVSRLLCDHAGKRTARFVAFACEEPPYFNVDSLGSQHHARQSRLRDDKIIGMPTWKWSAITALLRARNRYRLEFPVGCGDSSQAEAISWRQSVIFRHGSCVGNSVAASNAGLGGCHCFRFACPKRLARFG